MPDAQRYFIGKDCSSHRYLVPAEHKDEWDEWSELGELDDPRGWDVPTYAIPLGGGMLTFTDPVVG